ncbi:MAG: hypothetical protein IJO70_06335 [Lachnospiraceae bacterium]|nr:hypothetical protein [Lachnospiraceae bacterium]
MIKKNSNVKKLLLIMLCMMGFCLTGCNGSCMGCEAAYENDEEGYDIAGLSCGSKSCIENNSCVVTAGTVGYLKEETDEGKLDKVILISCDQSSNGCEGSRGCYNGCYIDDCSNCGAICGSEEGTDIDEKTIGCSNGEFRSVNSECLWNIILEDIYRELEIGGRE